VFPGFLCLLPTTVDSRSIVGGSHASSNRAVRHGFRAPSLRYLAERLAPPIGSAIGVC
jgi:alkanesulfonate monooxygenase